jgi:hypothetical protein
MTIDLGILIAKLQADNDMVFYDMLPREVREFLQGFYLGLSAREAYLAFVLCELCPKETIKFIEAKIEEKKLGLI